MSTPLTSLIEETRLLSGLRSNQLYTDAEIATMLSDLWQELFDRFVSANQHYRIKQFDFSLAGGVGANSVDLPSDFQLGNGLEMDPTQPRPRSVPYLSNWLQRNNLGASVLNIGGGNLCTDRQYCFVNSQLTVFPAERSNGDYRLHYTPMCEKFLARSSITTAIQASDTPVQESGFIGFVFTGLNPTSESYGNDGILVVDFDTPNDTWNGTYTTTGILGSNIVLTDTPWPGIAFTGPAAGTVTLSYQTVGTIDELPDYADPWAIYLKLGTSIAIREAREQDCTDLERRFAAQRLRVDSLLTNRQEEPTQPPLTRTGGFWDTL